MQKLKRILALTGVIALIALYAVTFILGITGAADTADLLMACIVVSVVLPVLLYGMFLIAHILDNRNTADEQEDAPVKKNSK